MLLLAPIILISIDTLRADHLSAYGYRHMQTPNIDSYAAHGTVYTNIDAQVPLTLPSHWSLLTSTYPFQNRVEENAERVAPGAVTLASVLRDNGYGTAAFIGSVFLEKQTGLDQGFETFDSPFQFEAFSPLAGSMFFGGAARVNSGRERRDGALVIRAATQWLKAHRKEPVFAFVHHYDLHKPYKLAGYDAEIGYVDRLLGTFQQNLKDLGLWDPSLVIVISDHGEGLGDHGESSHGYFVYRSTLWVPLIVHWPASGPAQPPQVKQNGGLIDVAPTILDYLHVPVPSVFAGKSLLSGGERGVYAESLHTHDSFGWAPLRSIRTGPLKYIDAPKPELYDLARDPHEQLNLIRTRPAEAQRLKSELNKLLAAYAPTRSPATQPLSPAQRALLGSLGYLSGRSGSKAAGSGADPKDRLPEFQLYERAQSALYEGHPEQATTLLLQLLSRDSQNTLARRDLGSCYLDRKLYAKAREHLEKAAAAAPGDYMTQFELGLAYEHLGQNEKAVERFQIACSMAPDAAQCKHELSVVQQRMKSP
jgi:arylsulfatase A-like enzyme